jgi:hypothetical protein
MINGAYRKLAQMLSAGLSWCTWSWESSAGFEEWRVTQFGYCCAQQPHRRTPCTYDLTDCDVGPRKRPKQGDSRANAAHPQAAARIRRCTGSQLRQRAEAVRWYHSLEEQGRRRTLREWPGATNPRINQASLEGEPTFRTFSVERSVALSVGIGRAATSS